MTDLPVEKPVSEGLSARLRERAASYRLGGPSSEHTAIMLEEAADALDSQADEIARLSADEPRDPDRPPMALEIALDFNASPQRYGTLRCPGDSKGELREALRVVSEALLSEREARIKAEKELKLADDALAAFHENKGWTANYIAQRLFDRAILARAKTARAEFLLALMAACAAGRFYSDDEARRQIGNLEAAGVDWQARALSAEARAEKAATKLKTQVPITCDYLRDNGISPHFAEILMSHYLDVADDLATASLLPEAARQALSPPLEGGGGKDNSPSREPSHTASDGQGNPTLAASKAEREQEDFLAFKLGYIAGFSRSAEGWNGEYPMTAQSADWLDEQSSAFAREQIAQQQINEELNAAASREFARRMAEVADGGAESRPPVNGSIEPGTDQNPLHPEAGKAS